MLHVTLPLSPLQAQTLRAGDAVLLSGTMLTGRDAAHKRLCALLDQSKPLPVTLTGETIYYVGPAPARPGQVVGPAGPTTSTRMDAYTPKMLAAGLRAMVGKGKRSPEVIAAMVAQGAVYFGVTGGAAALVARSIVASTVLCYEDLGAEAIHRFTIKDMPAVVLIDCKGNNLYEIGPSTYRKEEK